MGADIFCRRWYVARLTGQSSPSALGRHRRRLNTLNPATVGRNVMSDTKDCGSRLAALVGLVLLLAGEVVGQDLTRQFDEYLSALAGSGFTGAALVARGGKVTFAKGYGLANEEFDIPNTPQTKFRIASITKQFTAASILLLQERGQLSVTDSICKYVDECPKVWEPIAIHHLLSHTSG